MKLLQLSAGQGPAECALAVSKALLRLQQEASDLGLLLEILERVAAADAQGMLSVLVSVQGETEKLCRLARHWCGTVQWCCTSPYRPEHPRKNWFIGVDDLAVPVECPDWLAARVQFQSCKASGPGGQHVNKTASAIQATDPLTGFRVKVQSERSQHANKALALRLLASRVASFAQQQRADERQQRHRLHGRVERGRPVRVFKGLDFCPVD